MAIAQIRAVVRDSADADLVRAWSGACIIDGFGPLVEYPAARVGRPLLCLDHSGTPLLVQLFIIFYGLPSMGITIGAFPAAVIGFSLSVGAYNSEVLRAAIQSIPQGQWEAAESLSMTRSQILRRIILPQAARVSVPPLSNSFISLVKDTSLAATITVTEMFQRAQQIAAATYEHMLIYCEVALLYLLFSTILSALQAKAEKYFERYAVR